MKRALIPLMVLLTATLPAAAAEMSYPLLQIEDGDTLIVEIDGQPRRIQLIGIDAPEDTDNPKLQADTKRTGLTPEALLEIGNAATAHITTLLTPGQPLQLQGDLDKRDRYGRTSLQVLTADGQLLNRQMVSDGFAIVLGRYPLSATLKQELQRVQADAISGPRGLWQDHPAIMRRWSGQSQ